MDTLEFPPSSIMNEETLGRCQSRRGAALARLHWMQSGYCTGRELTAAECWFNLWDRKVKRVEKALATIDALVAAFPIKVNL